MDTNTASWIALVVFLLISTFGVLWLCTAVVGVLMFLIGLLSLLYLRQGDTHKFHNRFIANPLTVDTLPEGGVNKIVKQLVSPKKVQKTDSRVTGSELIDNSLQEILGYIIRDYISPWYSLISEDKEFTDVTVKKTAQTFAINISNRIKDIDWIPYITTRLVDDAASHLRLYKQARTKMKQNEKPKSPKNSPLKDQRYSPKRTHKRNKSETDVSWYIGKNELKKETEKSIGNSKFYGVDDRKSQTLEDYFFDLECQMENDTLCRDLICTEVTKEKEFLCEVVEILLYILLPDEDFQCTPLRYVLREIFVNGVILPLFAMISDPDYINQTIIGLCLRDVPLPSEIFLTVIRLTDSSEELKSTKDLVSKEIQLLRSRDSGGESDFSIKQQLNSLSYVLKLIDNRLLKLENLDSFESPSSLDSMQLESIKKIDLRLDQILKNNVALSYFIDYVSSQGKQVDLFFYLNIEGWKVSVEQQLSDLHINKIKGVNENATEVYKAIRDTASSIYEQYLGEKAEQKVHIKSTLVQTLYFRIRNINENPNELWFDDVQRALYEKMESNEKFLPAFKKSRGYIKLLQELDLVQQSTPEEDSLSLNSTDSLDSNPDQKTDSKQHFSKKADFCLFDNALRNVKHVRSFSDVTMLTSKNDVDDRSYFFNEDNGDLSLKVASENIIDNGDIKLNEKNLRVGDYTLAVGIIETGIVCEKGKTFGIYAVRVSRQYESNFLEEWHIYRRYSDFYDLHTKIKEKFPDLSKLSFPGKKTFHNMDRSVLERRMKMLGSYMLQICQPHVICSHHGLRDLLMSFLEQGDYDKVKGGPISSTINTLVNPLKSGMKTIKNMPEQFINTVDEVVIGLTKVFHTKPGRIPGASKVGASIEETDDNIPFRIMLLLMDEVFDLKSKNQWLRRRIVTLLRQIVRTMFGDIVNRNPSGLMEYLWKKGLKGMKTLGTERAWLPKLLYCHVYQIAYSLYAPALTWENSEKLHILVHDDEIQIIEFDLSSFLKQHNENELKHIIGSETTRRGLLTVFDLFQRPVLNRRILYTLLEGVICTLFPEKNMLKIFQKLYSKSKRIQEKNAHRCR